MNESKSWQPPETLWTTDYTPTGPHCEKFSLRKGGNVCGLLRQEALSGSVTPICWVSRKPGPLNTRVLLPGALVPRHKSLLRKTDLDMLHLPLSSSLRYSALQEREMAHTCDLEAHLVAGETWSAMWQEMCAEPAGKGRHMQSRHKTIPPQLHPQAGLQFIMETLTYSLQVGRKWLWWLLLET